MLRDSSKHLQSSFTAVHNLQGLDQREWYLSFCKVGPAADVHLAVVSPFLLVYLNSIQFAETQFCQIVSVCFAQLQLLLLKLTRGFLFS